MASVPSGETLPIAELAQTSPAAGAGSGPSSTRVVAAAGSGPTVESSLQAGAERCRGAFDAALAAHDARGAVKAALELEALVVEWSRDTLQSDEADRGRAALRAMLVRLGEAAGQGLRDPRHTVEPFVEALLESRRQARADRRWADADAVRDRLVEAGVEVRDTTEGTSWELR